MIIELKSLDEIDPCEFAYYANDPNINTYLRNAFPAPYTLDHALSFITHSLQHHALDFAIVVDGKCVGCVGVTFQKDIFLKNAEIGYWLNSQYWGKGIMSQVIKMLCSYLFSNYTIHKICADVFAENKASCIVLEKNGFIQEGYRREHIYKDGCYHDLILYALWRNSDEY